MTIRERLWRRVLLFRQRRAARTLGPRTRLAERLAPELVERLITDKVRALDSVRRADAWAANLREERDAARVALEGAQRRLEELTGGEPCSTCPVKAEVEQAREQREMALRDRDAAQAVLMLIRLRAGQISAAQACEGLQTTSARERQTLVVERGVLREQLDAARAEIARLRAGRAGDAQVYEDLRTASARERQALVGKCGRLQEQFDAAMGALDALYCAALGLHGLVATTPGHVTAYAALKAALKSARGPLGPWTKARGRRLVRVSEVRAGDRVCWAAAAGFVPLTVEAVSDRDCHGMVTLTGEGRLLHLHAGSMVTVESPHS